MTYKENITAILECCFAGFKEEIIEGACNRILGLDPKNSGNEILEIVLKEDIDEAPTIEAIPIPKDATNGDMIRAVFPKYYQGILSYLENSKWWNSLYKKEV